MSYYLLVHILCKLLCLINDNGLVCVDVIELTLPKTKKNWIKG
jgi:hypothetical protein